MKSLENLPKKSFLFRALRFLKEKLNGKTGAKSTRATTDTADPALIFNSAEIFQHCAVIVWDASSSDETEHLARGFAVLAALSVEQYLKCLLRLEGSNWIPRKHSPKLLFNHLKKETRRELRELHDQEARKLSNSFSSFEDVFGRKPTLDDLLEIANDAFDAFRYAYQYSETDNIGYGLNMFTGLVRKRILRLRPDWDIQSTSQAP